GLKLDHEDLKQLDEFHIEEMDLKWQVAMISIRLKKFYKKTGRKLYFDAKEPIGFDKNKVECFNCHNTWKFAKECGSKGNQESRRRDAENTGYKARDNGKRPTKQDEPKAMVTIDGEGVDWTSHAKNDLEDYALMTFNSSNSGSDTKDKSGLGYGTQIYEGVLSYENEVLQSVFDNRPSDVEDSPVNDRFAKVKGMHAVPPPMTRIYLHPKSNFGIDESKFTYETLESMPKPIASKPKAVSEPKVWSNAPIIEEYESDNDNECVSKSAMEQDTPSCAFINTVKHVKTPRQTVKDQDTCSLNPKVDKREWTGVMSKRHGLGYGYTKKHVLYVVVLVILLDIVTYMRKEWLNMSN
nr:ribonuclease H-like domain-containing protein [Tanacetum cinerariifolium]